MAPQKHIFTTTEKNTFTDISKRYSHVIENKETDGACLRAKSVAWDIIAREYNASPLTKKQVTTKQLRRLWMNMKQRQREAVTKERQHHIATGGGPSTSNSVINPDVSQITPAFIVGIDSPIDSDMLADSYKEMSQEEFSPPNTSPSHSPSASTSFTFTNNPRPSLHTMPRTSLLSNKHAILEQEYRKRQVRANELHRLEKLLLQEKIREAKAKADLAELTLRQHTAGDQAQPVPSTSRYETNFEIMTSQ